MYRIFVHAMFLLKHPMMINWVDKIQKNDKNTASKLVFRNITGKVLCPCGKYLVYRGNTECFEVTKELKYN